MKEGTLITQFHLDTIRAQVGLSVIAAILATPTRIFLTTDNF